MNSRSLPRTLLFVTVATSALFAGSCASPTQNDASADVSADASPDTASDVQPDGASCLCTGDCRIDGSNTICRQPGGSECVVTDPGCAIA